MKFYEMLHGAQRLTKDPKLNRHARDVNMQNFKRESTMKIACLELLRKAQNRQTRARAHTHMTPIG
jgi:hypothetical protein